MRRRQKEVGRAGVPGTSKGTMKKPDTFWDLE